MDPIIFAIVFVVVFGILVYQYGKLTALSIYAVLGFVTYLGVADLVEKDRRVFASVLWPVTLYVYLSDDGN